MLGCWAWVRLRHASEGPACGVAHRWSWGQSPDGEAPDGGLEACDSLGRYCTLVLLLRHVCTECVRVCCALSSVGCPVRPRTACGERCVHEACEMQKMGKMGTAQPDFRFLQR